MVKLFYDLETTGVNVYKHGIHQIAGMVEINGNVVEKFDLKVRPNPKAKIEQEALNIGGVTLDQIMAYPPMGRVYRKFLRIMGKYIDKYNPKDKAWLVGFNNRGFDDRFLRAWFEQNNDMYIGSWFWSDTLDVMVLASEYLLKRRSEMPSFKLKRVALELGLDVEAERLHDAYYDVELTRSIYRIVTGLDVEF
jgi:DNA polymerase-3 subunit epsilon